MRLKSTCWASAALQKTKATSAARTAPASLTSAPLEGGGALVGQSAPTLAQVVRGLALADALADLRDVGLGLGELFDGALHVGHGERGQARELGSGLVDAGLELGAVDQPIEVADAQQVLVGEILRQQEGALGEARAHLLGVAAEPARIGMHAQTRRRHERAHAL